MIDIEEPLYDNVFNFCDEYCSKELEVELHMKIMETLPNLISTVGARIRVGVIEKIKENYN